MRATVVALRNPPSLEARMNKIRLLSVTVESRSHLSDTAKNYLYDHLLKTMDMYDIGQDRIDAVDDAEVMDERAAAGRNRTDPEQLTMSDSIRICHLMSELGKAEQQSKNEQMIITELMASFIPVAVRKPYARADQSSRDWT